MLRLVWSAEALDDLETIIGYIAERNATAAEHPYLYRAGRVPGTREAVVHPNYILVYRVDVAVVDILSVLHARQLYP